jgi:hypothetical protein
MASPLRARLLAAKDIPSEQVTIPEWDNITLEIRGMTGAQQVKCSAAAMVPGNNGDEPTRDNDKLTRLMLLKSLFDPATGHPVLEDTDEDALWEKSVTVLNRLALIMLRLNGMDDKTGALLEKNSDATASAAGASA